jgi:multicomponent Na+:H+ antiporter subunit D
MMAGLHPAWPCLLGAAAVPFLPAGGRAAVAVAGPALALLVTLALPEGAEAGGSLLGLSVTWLRLDPLSRVFAIVFALFGALAGLYAAATPRPRLVAGGLAATGAALGITCAGDWVSLYAAWEALAVASWVLVGDGGTPRARGAALRYLLVHACGGALLLAGLAAHAGAGGGAGLGPLAGPGAAGLVLAAFAVNAAVPPLHAWLTDAYPESSPAGTVYLSAFATKTAVYALARVFPGTEVLVPVGAVMTLYGVVLAVLENDVRRLLGYHIVSQVGYMVAGIGLGSPLALTGAVAHAFSHILYKGLLLMATGTVVHATGRRRLTDLGGLARAMPATTVLYLVGALSISSAPGLNGFVSKAMVVDAAALAGRPVVHGMLLLASVGTFLSVGLKLPGLAFGGRAAPGLPRPAPAPRPMLAAMGLAAALCALTGSVPSLLYDLLPHRVDWRPYTALHVLESLQLLAGVALGAVLAAPLLKAERKVTVDVDRLYRALGRLVAGPLAAGVAALADGLERAGLAWTAPGGAPAGPGPSGSVAAGLVAVLVALGLLLLALGVS